MNDPTTMLTTVTELKRIHGTRCCRVLKRDYKPIWDHVNALEGNSFNERLFLFLGGTRGTCTMCGKFTRFFNSVVGYQQNCGRSCGANSLSRQEKRLDTINKMGHEVHYSKANETRKRSCLDKYGVEHALQVNAIKAKQEQTTLDRFGVRNAYQSDEIKQKIKQQNLDTYGVEFNSQRQDSRTARKNTFMERYGVHSPFLLEEFRTKVRGRIKERHGVEYALQSPECMEKLKQTNLERYGVEYVPQHTETQRKIRKNTIRGSYKTKTITINNKEFVCMGYEPQVLQFLVDNGVDVESITTDAIEPIPYVHSGKNRRYFPDIYISKRNTLLEVKSSFTYDTNRSVNLLKQTASSAAGFNHYIVIWSEKTRNLSRVIRNGCDVSVDDLLKNVQT